MVPVPPHNRKCQSELGMGSSCFILRTRSQARCTRGYFCPNSPLPTETGNPEWKCSTALPEQHGREAKGMFHTSVYVLHGWALSSIMSSTVKTQTCIRESVLPHPAPCWIGSTAYRTAGKRHLVAPREMLGNRKCFMCHLASEMWATAQAWEEFKHFVIFPQLVPLKQNGRKQIIMYSFCILFNPNLTSLITRLRSQTGTLWFQHIHDWYPARQERTLVLCDSKHTACLQISSWLKWSMSVRNSVRNSVRMSEC